MMQHFNNIEIGLNFGAVQKCLDHVDLVKSFSTSIHFQNRRRHSRVRALQSFKVDSEAGNLVSYLYSTAMQVQFRYRKIRLFGITVRRKKGRSAAGMRPDGSRAGQLAGCTLWIETSV